MHRAFGNFRHPATWNAVAIAVLVAGLAAATWIWQTQGRQTDIDPASLPGVLSPEDSAKYQRDVEIYYGKVGLLTEKWTRQAAELTHGKPLAELIGVLSIIGAAGCFTLGSILKRINRSALVSTGEASRTPAREP